MNLITGATGLVGTHLMLDLLRGGQACRALRRSDSDLELCLRVFEFWEPESGRELFERIDWAEASLDDPIVLAEALSGVKRVYHVAGLVSFSGRDKEALERVNVEGTANIINACLELGVNEFCHVSSVAAVGKDSGRSAIHEELPWKVSSATSPYALSKYRSELEVWRAQEEGLKVLIVNPGVVLGPGDAERSSTAIFGKVKKGMPFYTTGINGFVDVRDVSRALIELSDKGQWGKRFILVGENLAYRDLIRLIATAFGKEEGKIQIRPWMIRPAALFFALKDRLSGKNSGVSYHSLRSTMMQTFYSSDRVNAILDLPLRPLGEIIRLSCQFLAEPRG